MALYKYAYYYYYIIIIHWRWNEFESGGGHRRSGAKAEAGTDPVQSAGIFFCRAAPLFLVLKVQLVVLVSAFWIVSTV